MTRCGCFYALGMWTPSGEVCVATLDRYSSDPHQEINELGRVVDALGSEVEIVSIIGGSTVLLEAFREHLGSGYRQKTD